MCRKVRLYQPLAVLRISTMPPKKEPVVFTLSSEQLEELADKVMNKIEEKLSARDVYVDKQISELKSENEDLGAKTDDLEQRSRLENLRIFGITEKPAENTDRLVIDVATKVGVTLSMASISRSHRVGPKRPDATRPRAIIVKFVSYADRQRLFTAKKLLKGSNITLKEDLTAVRQKILKKASDHFKDYPVWSQNGVIIIKLNDGFHRIQTLKKLEELIDSQ